MRSLILVLVFSAGLSRAAEEIPQWVRDAASMPVHSYPAKVSSVALLSEEAVTVDVDGRRLMRERGAIRILQTGGGWRRIAPTTPAAGGSAIFRAG